MLKVSFIVYASYTVDDKSIYFKNQQVLTHKTIYICKGLLESFLTVCRTLPKVHRQKLQNRRFIPERCLDADVLVFINAKELEKGFFSSTIKLQSIYVYCLL